MAKTLDADTRSRRTMYVVDRALEAKKGYPDWTNLLIETGLRYDPKEDLILEDDVLEITAKVIPEESPLAKKLGGNGNGTKTGLQSAISILKASGALPKFCKPL